MRQSFQAIGRIVLGGLVIREGSYPVIPAIWPNRATRRAVKQNRPSRLSAPWKHVISINPQLRAAIKSL